MATTLIPFRNTPFTTFVPVLNEAVELTPVVYDAPDACGLAVLFPHGTMWQRGPMHPRDLVAGWRATEIIRHFKVVNKDDLYDVYAAARRNPDLGFEEAAASVIAEIGRETYDEIMALPVPEEIIQIILDGQDDDWPPSPSSIEQEVRAGTIKWRQGFTKLGIKRPDSPTA